MSGGGSWQNHRGLRGRAEHHSEAVRTAIVGFGAQCQRDNALFFNVAAFVGVGLTLYPLFYSLADVPMWKAGPFSA